MVLSNGLRFSWVCLGRFLVLLQKDLPQMDTDKKGWDTDEISLALDYTRIAREFICDLLSKQKDQLQMDADMIRALSKEPPTPRYPREPEKLFICVHLRPILFCSRVICG